MSFRDAVSAWLRRAGSPGPSPPRDARPADGRVEVVSVAGARGDPNPDAPRFQRFVDFEGPRDDAPELPRRNARRVPPLLGRVVIVSVFVGRDGTAWSGPEIAQAHRALERAAGWLEREAQRYDAPVNVDLANTYFAADDTIEEDVEIEVITEGGHDALFERLAIERALASASRAAAALGQDDIVNLVARATPRIDADHLIWALHLRRAGRSMAVAADQAPIPGLTLAICYAREENLPQPLRTPPFADPITFVHEALHLFGASDKYLVPLSDYPRSQVTERDIMALYTESLSRLRVDPLTAREIGWPVPGPRSARE